MNTLSRVDSAWATWLSPPSSGPPSPASPSSSKPKGLPDSARRSSSTGSPSRPRLSNLPPTPRKRAKRRPRPKPTTSSIKLPPPSTPWLLRLFLTLWSLLLAFWTSLVGETRAERVKRGRRRAETVLRSLRSSAAAVIGSSDEGSGSDVDGDGASDGDGEGGAGHAEGWVDPVTRAPPEGVEDEEELNYTPSLPSANGVGPDPAFTFRLRSADKREPSPPPSASKEARLIAPYPPPASILSNPLPKKQFRSARLLPNPISTSLLDSSVPAVPASRTLTAASQRSRPHHTPFHLRKTLILDLDETLIHSTSRPINYATHGGGGLLGLNFGGLLGKGKLRQAGHNVEVVLNGRSTTYHVYKRPYVDHFLKKVSAAGSASYDGEADFLQVASWYTLVIFTASMPEYADPVIEWLDGGRGLFAKRFYRESCFLQHNGSYIKDLSIVEADLSRVCFMDNSPVSYAINKGQSSRC